MRIKTLFLFTGGLCLWSLLSREGAEAQPQPWDVRDNAPPTELGSRHPDYGTLQKLDRKSNKLYVTGFGTYDPQAVLNRADMERQARLAARLPGYLVPRLVRERPGEPFKGAV